MNRRAFLTRAKTLGENSALADWQTSPSTGDANPPSSGRSKREIASNTGLEHYAGAWGFAQAAHLLRRTTFGANVANVKTILAGTLDQAVDLLLTQPAAPTPPVVYYQKDGTATQGQPWTTLPFDITMDNNRFLSWQAWWIGLMQNQGISLQEKIVLFWHNRFVTSNSAVNDARYMYNQNVTLRANAFGNFKDLTRSMTFDLAMLRYLSGNVNTIGHPNENYGRELQELFTIGKGPEVTAGDYTNYSEADVKAAARVLTGWKDHPDTMTVTFTPADHDVTDKQFSKDYQNTVIKGSTDEAGARREIDDLLTMIFNQRAIALNMARNLYLWFIDYEIDQNIQTNVIGPLADLLIQNQYEMKPVLKTLLTSAHFFDTDHVGSMIKNPMDFAIGTLRVFNVVFPNMVDTTRLYYSWIGLNRNTTAPMAMPIGLAPNVAGWPAYYQAPAYYDLWINTDTLQKRVLFTNSLAVDGYQLPENQLKAYLDVLSFAKMTSNPSDPNIIISEWSTWLFPVPIDSGEVTTLHNILMNGLPDYEWGVEWNDHIMNPTDATKQATVENKLRALAEYMLGMAEYQLM